MESEGRTESYMSAYYYGVYLPSDSKSGGIEGTVYYDKTDVLRFIKTWKKARFKAFTNFEDALYFAKSGHDVTMNDSICESSNIEFSKEFSIPEPQLMVGEKPSPFKGPKSQDLVKFRKLIETGDYKKVRATIWENPRYLVSSGDTPSILQEGFRYNALHIAAKANRDQIADIILRTVSNVKLIKLLYGDCNLSDELANDRANVLLDLYLNTPDKGLNETPLHFAVKYGSVEVVEILLSYSQCDRTLKNKFGNSPDAMICDRYTGDEISAKKKKISLLLEGSYYVPVLRANDNSMAPKVGEPFSPASPPVLNDDPLSPRLEISAYAGPLNRKEADHFRKAWKTPPRKNGSKTLNPRSISESMLSLKYKDPERGLERLGKSLAVNFDVNWKEYWPFLDSFIDISSKEGLRRFETYLSSRLIVLMAENDEINTLTALLKGCSLLDANVVENNFSDPFLCLEKACQVFSNRIAGNIVQIVYNNNADDVSLVMLKELKQNESFIKGYICDVRFHKVNFKVIHSRLGCLLSQKIKQQVQRKNHDAGTILCLLNRLRNTDDQDDRSWTKCLIDNMIISWNDSNCLEASGVFSTEYQCEELWMKLKTCSCEFDCGSRNVNNINVRNNKTRGNINGSRTKRFKDSKVFSADTENDLIIVDVLGDSDDSDSENYFTPPSSPLCFNFEEDFDDDYKDAEELEDYVFIEGIQPNKVDCEVFNALESSNCTVDKELYPNIYKWYHAVSLFSPSQRRSWRNVGKKTGFDSPRSLSNSFIEDKYSPGSPFLPKHERKNLCVLPKSLSFDDLL